MKPVVWLVAAGVGVLAFPIARVVGLGIPHAVTVSLLCVVAVLLVAAIGSGTRSHLTLLQQRRRAGTRSEVSTLSWGLRGATGISRTALAHMREVSILALSEAGISLEDPEGIEHARQAVGATWTDFLLGDGPEPRAKTIEQALRRLEELERSL